MAIRIDPAQTGLVEAKRKAKGKKPQYFNAGIGQKVPIGDDFEAFLILLGGDRLKQSVQWLQTVSGLAIQDFDRDALLNYALTNDLADAKNRATELRPIIRQFEQFRTSFSLSGFEDVAEAKSILSDMQRAMSEIKTLGDRITHRVNWDNLLLSNLQTGGLTSNQKKQLDSWFGPLTSY